MPKIAMVGKSGHFIDVIEFLATFRAPLASWLKIYKYLGIAGQPVS
jgi:hypothetical protein